MLTVGVLVIWIVPTSIKFNYSVLSSTYLITVISNRSPQNRLSPNFAFTRCNASSHATYSNPLPVGLKLFDLLMVRLIPSLLCPGLGNRAIIMSKVTHVLCSSSTGQIPVLIYPCLIFHHLCSYLQNRLHMLILTYSSNREPSFLH